ncbi:hypothetical protein AgCh_035216 [Apium graveolens]
MYYPRTHILNASRNGGASFIWSGIFAAKESLKSGFKWTLGNGTDICVKTDPWIRGKEGFLFDPGYDIDNSMKVAYLFKRNSLEWDKDKINSLFNKEDAAAILNMRIPQHNSADKMAWVHSTDGKYTVKTGYRMWQESYDNQVATGSSNGWKRIWKLQVPSKVKFFLWRFCRNNIPVRSVLKRKCRMVPLPDLQFDMGEVEDATIWLLEQLATENNDKLVKVVMTLWAIWFFRNKKVWDNKIVTPDFAVNWSLKQLQEWKIAVSKVIDSSERPTTVTRREGTKWTHLEQGKLKVNVDASIEQGSSCYSIGMILRDHTGGFLEGKTMKFSRMATVIEAEASVIEEALEWIVSKGVTEVLVESDSQLAVQAINGNASFQLEVGHSIDTYNEESICSFLAAHVEVSDFGHLRLPEDFKSVCGGRIPTSLKIYCKTHKWRARYDSEIGKICGLARFMEFYEITIYTLVLFDYHGDGVFNVKIYKEAAIGINYPMIEPNEWMLNKPEWKDEEFMVVYGNIQFQKSVAMLVYDNFLNKTEAYRISVNSADLQGDGIDLTMKSGMENFYKNFKHENSVSLRMHNDIENMNNVNVCIYKHDVYEKDLDRGNLFAPKSFLKIISKDTLACGGFILPKQDKSVLNWKSVLILKSELKWSELKLSGDIYQEIISGLKGDFQIRKATD